MSTDQTLDSFIDEIQELIKRYPEMDIFLYAIGPVEHGIIGNGCPACSATEVMGMLLTGRLQHTGLKHDNVLSQKANMN